MALIVVGANHRTAQLEVRERFAHTPAEARASLRALLRAGVREAVMLSTCNRTELYLVEGDDDGASHAWSLLSERLGADAAPHGYVRRDREAVAHLYRVASGMDSMILGEAQIHGQVRDAWEGSRAHSGAVLNRLFQSALNVAGRVRAETALGRGSASVSSAAVQLARQIFGSLRGRRAMVLGAGEMAELALDCFVREGVHAAIVASRSFDRAVRLAARYGATAMDHDAGWAELAEVDVLLCATGAPHSVVTLARIAPAITARQGRPLCVLDIAMPRDVEPAVRSLDGVFLYDLDDLRAVVDASLERRRDQLPSAEDVVREEVERYWEWLAGLAAVPVLTQLRTGMELVRRAELEATLRKLEPLSPAARDAIDHLSRTLMNKFLHEPSVRLRAAAANGRGLEAVDLARYLFGVPELHERPEADDGEEGL